MFKNVNYFFTNYLMLNMGAVLIMPLFFKSKEDYDKVKDKIIPVFIKVIMGIGGIFFSVFLLFFPYENILLIGDLLPALVIFINSIMFIFQYIKISPFLSEQLKQKSENYLLNIQIPFALISIIAGLLHILFPNLILL